MNNLTIIGKNMLNTAYYFAEVDILSEANKQELTIKINWLYNQVARLDNRINEMIALIPLWNDIKWNNIIKQRDARQIEFEQLLAAYNKSL